MELLELFTYKHLPPHLKEVSKPFCELAFKMAKTIPNNRQLELALDKLMESKDCAVRAVLVGGLKKSNT